LVISFSFRAALAVTSIVLAITIASVIPAALLQHFPATHVREAFLTRLAMSCQWTSGSKCTSIVYHLSGQAELTSVKGIGMNPIPSADHRHQRLNVPITPSLAAAISKAMT